MGLRILLIGASGTIGTAVGRALERDHELLRASLSSSEIAVDMTDADSIREMYRKAGPLDAVVSAAGAARFKPFAELTEDDFEFSIRNKLMGQVNLVRLGMSTVRANGSFTITSGVLASRPMKGSGAVSLVNAGLEGFARAAALEAPHGIRVNAVSPPWVAETLKKLKMDVPGALPADVVARAYVRSVTGTHTGEVIEPK